MFFWEQQTTHSCEHKYRSGHSSFLVEVNAEKDDGRLHLLICRKKQNSLSLHTDPAVINNVLSLDRFLLDMILTWQQSIHNLHLIFKGSKPASCLMAQLDPSGPQLMS